MADLSGRSHRIEYSSDAPWLLDRFEIVGSLGDGGMGVVYEARDTLLDRRIALKLIRPDATSDKAPARLLREAQALARLKHPNVVTVFEVGTAGGNVFVAMELVEGGTLREWMRERHSWREVAAVFLAIGRGLAAAHELGLVHRDVKPENVFIDGDGTPKLGDFGLVGIVGAVESGVDALGSPRDRTLTTQGSAIGTPAYMAPEQVMGGTIDARTDQYAFCASMYEALTGVLPSQPGGRRVPRRVEPIVQRGLADDIEDRYPTLDELLADLERAMVRPRRTLAIAGALALAATSAGTWALATAASNQDDPCSGSPPELAAVWNPMRRAALSLHARRIDATLGDERFAIAVRRADAFAREWSTSHAAMCRDGAPVQDDLRTSCLARHLVELDDGIALVERAADVPSFDAAVVGLTKLAPLDGCADLAALIAAAPPSDPQARSAIERIEQEVAHITARANALVLDGLAARARAAVADARALGHKPTLALALAELARVDLALSDAADGTKVLRELTQVAADAHDDRDAAYAWTRLLGVLADRGNLDEARTLVPAARAAVLRAGAAVDLRADLLFEEAVADHVTKAAAEGLRKLDEARALLDHAGRVQPGSPFAARYAGIVLESAVIRYELGDHKAAFAGFEEAIALYRELFGRDSVAEAFIRQDQGESFRRIGRLDEALAAHREGLRIRRVRAPGSSSLAMSIGGVAETLSEMRRWPEARDAFTEALALDRKLYPDDDPAVDYDRIGLARPLAHLGREAEARKIYDEALARLERTNAGSLNLELARIERAMFEASTSHCDRALADYTHAIASLQSIAGERGGWLLAPLVGQGRCLLVLGRLGEAIEPLRRAVASITPQSDASDAARARFYLGRALVESRRDPASALRDARSARDALVATKLADPDELAAIDHWLATR
jgi:eukaryotic-like serine/threonine-protein kinase